MKFIKSNTGYSVLQKSPYNQILRTMRLTALLVVLSIMQLSAKSFGQITLNMQKTSIITLTKAIEAQTDYVFLYNEDKLPNDKITINVKNASIDEVLSKYFKKVGIDYRIVDKNITLKPTADITSRQVTREVLKQVVNVRGTVRDSLGNPLAQVNIKLENNTSPTLKAVAITNADGFYQLTNVPEGGVIVFSAIGYLTKKVTIPTGGDINKTIDVVLKQEIVGLKEVTINTGIYTRKLDSYTGSTLVIKGEDLKKVGNANFFQSLRNISPSMVLDNFAAGANPNTMPDIQLRGTSTFPINPDELASGLKGNYVKSPNEPLFILDGFETNVERVFDLDMNRIESVTILKDAASKAIYGAKAANGVVVIETKKLTSGSARVVYNNAVDLELPDLTSYNLTNSIEKLEAEVIDGFYVPRTASDPASHIAGQQLYNARRKLALEGLDTYWLAKPLQNGVGQKHALSVELGGTNLNIIADVAYRKVSGAMIGSNRENISGNISTSYRLKSLLFRNIMSAISNMAVESPYGTFSDYARMNPYWRSENPDGTIPFLAEINTDGTTVVNPLYNSTINSNNSTQYFNFINNFYLEWTVLPGLRATTRLGIDVKNSKADEFYPAGHTRFSNYFGPDQLLRKGSYQVNNGNGNYLSGDLNINYAKEINKHVIFGNLGFNVSERKNTELIHLVEGFPSDRMDNIIFARGYRFESRPTGVDNINRELGVLGALSYMYDNRFLSDFTFRSNASSQFGANKRWANFWSLGLGWNLHNEAFLKGSDLFKTFKLRGSLGATGNSNFARNNAIATYTYYQNAFYQNFPGSSLASLANPDLQWESKFDYNAGADVSIGNLNLRFDYYQAYTENLIANISTPTSTGFNTVKDNLGRVKNTGVELYASYTVFNKGGNFLNLNFGLETNKNKIVRLSNAMKTFNENMDKIAADLGNSKPVKRYEDGMSMNAIWVVPSLGIDPATGKEIYVDREGNTTFVWNANDMVVGGNSNPDFQGTFGFSGEYKGIGLSVVARYLGGGQLYNQTLVDRVENALMNYNVDKRVLTGRWTTPGQESLFKRLGQYNIPLGNGSFTSAQEQTRATSRFVQDRNEIVVSAVNLYYQFNQQFTRRLGMERLKVGFNMNELATFSSIRLERGTNYPFARTLSFNLSATF
ncbi:SusC/RagA family TonB-linked outer membrane protein [Pedobacter insulae]|nr:SusC/RagA family TonB-linked outer membrane protein [Pedobacter insulae]